MIGIIFPFILTGISILSKNNDDVFFELNFCILIFEFLQTASTQLLKKETITSLGFSFSNIFIIPPILFVYSKKYQINSISNNFPKLIPSYSKYFLI